MANFATTNKADLNTLTGSAKTNAVGILTSLTTATTGVVDRLEAFQTGREAGLIDFHEGAATKATLRDGIMQELGEWNETASTIASAETTPEIMKGFRLPYGVSSEVFGARVRAICDHAEEMQDKFTALAYDADFVDQMRERVDAFETADDDKSSGMNGKTGARSALSEAIRDGVLAGRQLNVIFKKLYKENPEKRTAWATAFRTDRVGTRSKKNNPDEGPNSKGSVHAPTMPQATSLPVAAAA